MKLVFAGDQSPRRRVSLPTLGTIAVIKLLLMLCLLVIALLS